MTLCDVPECHDARIAKEIQYDPPPRPDNRAGGADPERGAVMGVLVMEWLISSSLAEPLGRAAAGPTLVWVQPLEVNVLMYGRERSAYQAGRRR